MKHILFAMQALVLVAVGVLLWQLWHKYNSIPDNEEFGEERSRYMRRRLNWIAICIALQAALQITSAILRAFEII